jgi:hypothetical protein
MSEVTNYTDEMVKVLVERYEAAPTRETVDALAEEMGRTSRSIISKLSNLGIYKAAERVTKTGKPVVRKSELVEAIGAAFGIEVPSLEKASKADLENIVAMIDKYKVFLR